MVMFIVQALLYYDPMGGENMPALSALLNYIGTYLRHFFCKNVTEMLVIYMVSTWNLFHFFLQFSSPRTGAHVQERPTNRLEVVGEGDGEGLAGAGEHRRLRDVRRQGRRVLLQGRSCQV